MRSAIYAGEVWHARLEGAQHRFRYPVSFFAFDLDELSLLDRRLPWFGYNRAAPVSLRDRDYLYGEGSLKERLLRFLAEQGADTGVSRATLVTCARFLGYAFNPVSFFYCYGADGTLRCVVAEVNNTFGERHHYLVPGTEGAQAEKVFHVSPFFPRDGTYTFHFAPVGETVEIRVDLYRNDRLALASRLHGRAAALGSPQAWRTLLGYPFRVLSTMPRILWEAANLYLRRRLNVYNKPVLADPRSLRTARPSLRDQMAERLVLRILARLRVGCLALTIPDRRRVAFGDPSSSLQASLWVKDPAFFWHVVRDGDIGFGESYVRGEWETDDLTALLRLFVENREFLDDRRVGSWVSKAVNRVWHLFRRNTLQGSRQNIHAHYDLGNPFFASFLDPSMMYSCALFESPDASLEEAQRAKNRAIIRKARLSASDHVLEIGSGWGGFAIQAVQETGCRVTTVTLSQQQYDLAVERVLRAGLSDRITVQIQDYRDITGEYDKIVSIEMFEAVGHEYFGPFFRTCDRLLKPDGLMVMQVITIADQRYEAYRKSTDWLQQYIFPGGLVPSLTAMTAAMTRDSRLMVEELENIGIHYARTLREWRERFMANQAELRAMGLDQRFQRTWLYYLAYCEAGFQTRTLGTLQLVLTRPNNKRLPQAV